MQHQCYRGCRLCTWTGLRGSIKLRDCDSVRGCCGAIHVCSVAPGIAYRSIDPCRCGGMRGHENPVHPHNNNSKCAPTHADAHAVALVMNSSLTTVHARVPCPSACGRRETRRAALDDRSTADWSRTIGPVATPCGADAEECVTPEIGDFFHMRDVFQDFAKTTATSLYAL